MRYGIILLVLAAVLTGTGCQEFKAAAREAFGAKGDSDDPYSSEYKPKYAFGINQIVKFPRAGKLERELTTFDGRSVWINTNQFFSSKNIEEVRLVPRSDVIDTYDVEAKLDRRGKIIWAQMSLNFRGVPMALLLDGIYINSFVLTPLSDEDANWVMIPGPFDKVTADGILKYSKKNYEFFNPSATSWF